ncbi:unnamed protein product [Oppiella nova]|uniref:Uncharacterized protein n=1 Tax=Oppiella nova TaxID=334625 RepID=A0A7R9LZK2_9ACAR|nr:unnamed protein product [Oppiella nova]CAG2168440.1 unnamed protein product [Oppiella nova]
MIIVSKVVVQRNVSVSVHSISGVFGGALSVGSILAISIVEKRRLTECVARTICELACNPDTYGDKGRAVYQTLKEFESESLPKLAFYKTARDRGQALTKTNCNECYTLYAKCKTPTETLLRLASALSIKS